MKPIIKIEKVLHHIDVVDSNITYHRAEGKLVFLKPSPNKSLTIDDFRTNHQPVIISNAREEIQKGNEFLVDGVMFTAQNDINVHDGITHQKILVNTDQLSDQHIADIIHGLISEGDQVLVECEEKSDYVYGGNLVGQDYYVIKFDDNNKVSLMYIQQEIEKKADREPVRRIVIEVNEEGVDTYIAEGYNLWEVLGLLRFHEARTLAEIMKQNP